MACQRVTPFLLSSIPRTTLHTTRLAAAAAQYQNQRVSLSTNAHHSITGTPSTFTATSRFLSTAPQAAPKQEAVSPSGVTRKYKIVVVGGGSGGCAVAAKFVGEGKNLAIIEPSEHHYYQPLWTLVGAGLKDFNQSENSMQDVLPNQCDWIKDKAVTFDPEGNSVTLASGDKIVYDYLVVAMGIQLDFDKIPGLTSALQSDPRVTSNYHPLYVTKTFPALQAFKGGNAVFTFPNTPIKCAGAPQKIMYLADEIFRQSGVRDKSSILFNTSLGVIFGVKKYANALLEVVKDRGIDLNFKHNLVEVDSEKGVAVFNNLDTDKTIDFKYDFLHVTPPMSCPDVLKSSPLVGPTGWVDVDKHSLQHTAYANIFSLGDCSSLPTSKTAAAIASQNAIVHRNLSAVMKGSTTSPLYDGYTSCPLVTSSKSCILAEFDYDALPLETMPWDQGKERRTSYLLKAHGLPLIYWQGMLRGMWNGPKMFRKLFHLGTGK